MINNDDEEKPQLSITISFQSHLLPDSFLVFPLDILPFPCCIVLDPLLPVHRESVFCAGAMLTILFQ